MEFGLIVVGLMLLSFVLGGVFVTKPMMFWEPPLYSVWRFLKYEVLLLPWTYRKLKRGYEIQAAHILSQREHTDALVHTVDKLYTREVEAHRAQIQLERELVELKEKLTRTQTVLGSLSSQLSDARLLEVNLRCQVEELKKVNEDLNVTLAAEVKIKRATTKRGKK